MLQDFYGGSGIGNPGRYFTSTPAWQIAYAIYLQCYHRIELWGFELERDTNHDHERPCFFYWVSRARAAGIDVFIPDGVRISEPGDPHTYFGPLYGWETT